MLSLPRSVWPAILLLAALSLACSGDGVRALPVPTDTPAPTATLTPSPLPTASATPFPLFPTFTPTPVPPTPTPTPSGGLSFKPSQLVQGGVVIVYLHEPAASATVRFQDRQYPMLNDGQRWWAIIGVGALSGPGLLPLSVVYNPMDGGASRTVAQSVNVSDREFPVEHITLDPSTAALLAPDIIQAELAQRASIYSGYTAQRLWSGALQLPARGARTGHYGEGRSYNNGPVTDYHRGTDFAGEIGAPVYAAAAGRVVFNGALRVRGNAIMIDHGAGLFTAYHHLSASDVSAGQTVAAGERIGAIGSTGLVTGPHLHWEVIVRGVEVDGELWLQGAEVGP